MILSEPEQRSAIFHLQSQRPPTFVAQHLFVPDSSRRTSDSARGHRASRSLNPDDFTNSIDIDDELPSQSLSSSPLSTQSLLSQYSAPLPALDRVPTFAIPRAVQEGPPLEYCNTAIHNTLPLFGQSDMMQADAWLQGDRFTPKAAGRQGHQRESSLSSLGSAGPASPFSHNTSNPQIAVTDSVGDGFHGLAGHDELNYQLVKFPAAGQEAFYPNYPNYTPTDAGALQSSAFPDVAAQPRLTGGGVMFLATDHTGGSSRSRPLSMASSVNSDSPATPPGELEDDRRRKSIFNNAVPKLDRTMTDVYNDELYSPNFSVASAASIHIPVSPKNDVFAQRVQAANSQHLSAGHSPVSSTSRDKSPFRTTSPLAPSPSLRFGTAQRMREQSKAAHDNHAVQHHLTGNVNTVNPPTISPKDALLDFADTDGSASTMPLFETNTTAPVSQSQQLDALVLDDASFSNYVTSQLPPGLQLPQQYPFIAQPRQTSTMTSLSSGSLPQSRLSSVDIASSNSSHANSPQRPTVTSADGGTYTCTYHGCTLRFDTPALLQKHKREGHRQAHGLGPPRKPEGPTAITPISFNSQAGPHRCDRINPTTGKPCNTVFSRPYDLTRHEDTIHNARKQKVRCDLCTDDKSFSRADALTRHYRVCHPDVELQGKHRRKLHG